MSRPSLATDYRYMEQPSSLVNKFEERSGMDDRVA